MLKLLCPLRHDTENKMFLECLEKNCAWFDDETGKCEITNLSLISKLPLEIDLSNATV